MRDALITIFGIILWLVITLNVVGLLAYMGFLLGVEL